MNRKRFVIQGGVAALLLFLSVNPAFAQIFGRRGPDCECDRVINWQDQYANVRALSEAECAESEVVRDQARNLRDQSDQVERIAREQQRRANQLGTDARKLRGEIRDIHSEARILREKVRELDEILSERDPFFEEKIVAFRTANMADTLVVVDETGISWAEARDDWHFRNRTYARDGVDFYRDAAETLEDLADLKSQEAIAKDRARERIERSASNLESMSRTLTMQAEDLEKIEQIHERGAHMYCVQASVQFMEDYTGNEEKKRDLEKVIRYVERNYDLFPTRTVAEIQLVVENAKASLR